MKKQYTKSIEAVKRKRESYTLVKKAILEIIYVLLNMQIKDRNIKLVAILDTG